MRLYTAGIADFESVRQDGRIYVDKTDLIYKLTKESKFVFLSRPRRFGKSLLCSTLKYYISKAVRTCSRVLPSASWRRTGSSIPCCISI